MTNITCPDCGGFAPVRVKRCEYCANDRVAELEAEVERLRAALLEALPSVYAEMGLTDYVNDLHRQLAQLTQALNAARDAAATWKRSAKMWRGVSQLGDGYDGMMYRLVRGLDDDPRLLDWDINYGDD